MFRIKICGITRIEDGLAAAMEGADAIGFNFSRKSPRYIEGSLARYIGGELPKDLLQVGVFTNSTVSEIKQTIEETAIRAVQLHGDESPQVIAALPLDVQVIRAIRIRETGLAPLAEFLAAAESSGRLPDAVLVDAYSPHALGGTGQTVDWQRVNEERLLLQGLPLILAGGLTPRNVADAIGLAKPDGVDTASGVEISPGIKDKSLLRGFITAAHESLKTI